MSKIKTKEDTEQTLQLTPSQIQQAVSEAKKIAAQDVAQAKRENLINWDEQIAAFKTNPPKTVEEAVARIVTECADPEASAEDRAMLEQMMKDNPAIVKVLKDFIR